MKSAAFPTSNHPESVGNGRFRARTGEVNSSIYLGDCKFRPNTGGGDCFHLCLEKSTGRTAYSQSVLLSSAMTVGDLKLYRAILTLCEAELSASTADQANGVPISEIRIEGGRIGITSMEFRRKATDVLILREEVLSMSYIADSIAIERLQLELNAKVVFLRSRGGRGYVIQYDVLQNGVVNFAPGAFVVVKYDGPHYDPSVDSSEKK